MRNREEKKNCLVNILRKGGREEAFHRPSTHLKKDDTSKMHFTLEAPDFLLLIQERGRPGNGSVLNQGIVFHCSS